MSNRIQQITIDINSDNNFQYVRAIQGDSNTNLVEITVLADGTPYEIDSSKIVTLRGTKADGKQILNSCEVTGDNTILIKTTEQLTSTIGRSKYEISFYGNDSSSSETTFPFYIVVVESAVNAKTVVSSNEFTALQDAIYDTNQEIDTAKQTIAEMYSVLDETNSLVDGVNTLKTEVSTLKTNVETNEKTRQTNETTRQSQEEKRETDTQTALNNMSTAISNAETATTRANKAAQDCEDIVAGTGFIKTSEKGVANGIATLDSNGHVLDSQLSLTKSSVGLDNVDNKSSETIRSEITSNNVTNALGYTPENANATKIDTTITVSSSGWSSSAPYTQTVAVDGLTEDSKYILLIKLYLDSNVTSDTVKSLKKNYGYIDKVETGGEVDISSDSTTEGLIFTCYNKKPTVDITLKLKEV